MGTCFEEELVVPYLESVVGPEEYVRNSMWVDFTCETDAGAIRIKGATDPVLVDAESEPLLLTESKTKGSIEHLDGPNRHHKAQVHAYMYGLTEKYDRRVTDALLIYGDRTSLDVETYHVGFDPWFWREVVLGWAEGHTQYRLDGGLPPADPEFGWECEFCDYSHRCGQEADTDYEDVGPEGFLPLFDEYPEQNIVEHLEAREEVKLTPTLAHEYRHLAETYDVLDWCCHVCGAAYDWNAFGWDGNPSSPPLCPSCRGERDAPVRLRGPSPEGRLESRSISTVRL